MADRALFILSALMTKTDAYSTSTAVVHGYRVTTDEDTAKGSFVQFCFQRKPEFTIADLLCLEVPKDAIALLSEPTP